jgi:ABC-type glycerol-3-phosphate transport system permease component
MTPRPLLLPYAVTWRFWERVLASGQITAPLWKSLGVASGVALLALAFAGPAAYSLAQLPVRWLYGIPLSLLLCRMLPKVSGHYQSQSFFCAGACSTQLLASSLPT